MIQLRPVMKAFEIKSTLNKKGKVDMHGARNQWLCVWVYEVDKNTEPAIAREPMRFKGIYLSRVTVEDFKRYERGELGTRTSSLSATAMHRFREGWVYKL